MVGLAMQGKTVLITGATDGIGKQAAKELATMGAQTVLVGRNTDKCAQTVAEVAEFSNNPQVSYLQADLSIMGDVKNLAEKFQKKFSQLDVLVNNAGGGFLSRKVTVDGFEHTFALNHLAYFLLTELLLDMLKQNAPSRVINVSSGSHYRGKIRFDDPHFRRFYFVLSAYSQSKLANVMHTYALARRLEESGVTANCMHPGLVRTGIFKKVSWFGPLIDTILTRKAISVEEGAESLVYLASSEKVAGQSGHYYYKKMIRTTSDRSYDVEAQERLWAMSREMLRPWLASTT